MRIFLSHRSRDKALLREFRSQLPSFLETGLDEESLSWGDSFPTELKLSIQSGVDFLIIFLDNDALSSEWVKQELEWAIEREKELREHLSYQYCSQKLLLRICRPDFRSDYTFD
jgi:hypothetical protein